MGPPPYYFDPWAAFVTHSVEAFGVFIFIQMCNTRGRGGTSTLFLHILFVFVLLWYFICCIPEQFSILFGSHLSERSDEHKNLI